MPLQARADCTAAKRGTVLDRVELQTSFKSKSFKRAGKCDQRIVSKLCNNSKTADAREQLEEFASSR